jgi:hypothetical protein
MKDSVKRDIETIRELLDGEDGQALWHILTALRGPDSPSERQDQSPATHARLYEARRERKRRTGEVIRGVTFPGVGAARFRTDIDFVTVPPASHQDHYDRHVVKAAHALGLGIVIDEALGKKVKAKGKVKVNAAPFADADLNTLLTPPPVPPVPGEMEDPWQGHGPAPQSLSGQGTYHTWKTAKAGSSGLTLQQMIDAMNKLGMPVNDIQAKINKAAEEVVVTGTQKPQLFSEKWAANQAKMEAHAANYGGASTPMEGVTVSSGSNSGMFGFYVDAIKANIYSKYTPEFTGPKKASLTYSMWLKERKDQIRPFLTVNMFKVSLQAQAKGSLKALKDMFTVDYQALTPGWQQAFGLASAVPVPPTKDSEENDIPF